MTSQLTSPPPPPYTTNHPLPYGYQIDLDFVRYCENLANVDPSDAELQRRHRRRQRQSMEVMLGIQQEIQQQMNELNGEFWDKKAPEPPPRSHLHHIESPIVPKLTSRVTQWDPALTDVVSDFERTLERSKKDVEVGKRTERAEEVVVREIQVEAGKLNNAKETCISPPTRTSSRALQSRAHSENPRHHISIESIDGISSIPISPPERTTSLDKKRIHDLEEQVKLIPLLQMQIQSLKDERKQLLVQLENSRAPSSTSSSSTTNIAQQQQPQHFHVHRVSPVSLHSMKLPAQNSTVTKRTVGTNTNVVLRRDVGISSEKSKFVNSSTLTEFRLPCDGHDRLYSEKDLMKTVELVHAKMRKDMNSVGVQYDEVKAVTKSVGTETKITVQTVASNTEEPQLMSVSTGSVSIAPVAAESREVSPALSLRDMNKPPVVRSSATQTTQGSVHHQMTQATPLGSNKSTDSTDLIRTVHRSSGTEIIHKKDQIVHTGDLVKVQNSSTNTTPPPVIQKRTTASNTNPASVRSIGVNCEEPESHLSVPLTTSNSGSKIPRPSPGVQRKFLRQDTFTVTTDGGTKVSVVESQAIEEEPKSFEPYKFELKEPIQGPKETPRFSPLVDKPIIAPKPALSTSSDTESKSPSPPPSVAAILSKLNENLPLSPTKSETLKYPTPHSNLSSIFGNTSRESSPRGNLANPNSLFEYRRTPERERTPVSECPAEKIAPILTHHRSPSPKLPDEPVAPSKMPISPSIEYLDDDEEEEEEEEFEDDEFNDEQLPTNMPMRPPPTSISTIRLVQEGRVRIKPSKEMMSALKVINDHLEKHPEPVESQIRSAIEIAASEWFQISSTEKANPDNVEDYLDYFEEQSWDLLTFMVNLVDKNGNMAMHYAVSHGNFDVVSILLDSKVCDINQTNKAGYTCIMLVSLAKLVVSEHRTVVQRLFKLADVNIRAEKNSQTALMLAVSHGNVAMVQMLTEAGADINIQDDDGSTALMCAAEQGHLDIIKYFLAQPDCDSTKIDVDGNTALKISLEAGYHDIGCLLYAHEHLLRSKVGVKRTSSRKSSTSSLT